ncbi:MAG: hypothetical protein P9X24_01810 [Candidatus Hatepunaea meridiana]|nr:hypothetical protein [Candidatus Hatepunaea meridiana]
MAAEKKLSKISGIFHGGVTSSIVEALNSAGIVDLQLTDARTLMLREKKGPFGIGFETVIVEEHADFLSFLVPSKQEKTAMNLIVDKSKMDTSGRYTIFSEDVRLIKNHDLCQENFIDSTETGKTYTLQTKLMGICCIVYRGEGNHVARVALDTGTCVPGVTFGIGTGLRDKLGLLRITIPAAKEVINLIASSDDAEAVMDMMINAGNLDQPGKGFIFLYPVGKGIINRKVTRELPKHAASMEQIIAAMDEIEGGTRWRLRSMSGKVSESKQKRAYLENLTNLIVTCNEGRGNDLVKAAMSVGAAGATIIKLKHISPSDSEQSKISPAREESNLVVGENLVPDIVDAIEKAGGFDDKTHGRILAHPIPKACTYLGGKK